MKELVIDSMCLFLELDLPCTHEVGELSDSCGTTDSNDVKIARANAYMELQRGALRAQKELERALRRSAQKLKVVLQARGEWANDIPLEG
jgi:hypothetical protein